MKKFLFLDIDGVLNSLASLYKFRAEIAGMEFDYSLFKDKEKSKEFQDFTAKVNSKIDEMRHNGEHIPSMSMDNYPFSKESIQHLNEIIDVTGCKVILSSSWRHTSGLAGTQKKLEENGFKYKLHDMTPTSLQNSQRGNEIAHWLKWNEAFDADIAIVDDDWQDIYGYFPDHLVVTTFRLGLTHKEKDKILSLLI